MARLYIDGNEVKITRTGTTHLSVEWNDGTVVNDLEPHRLFPVNLKDKYITLLDEKNCEKAIIRDISALDSDSRAAVSECIENYYMIPKITKMLARSEDFGILTWTVLTDRGEITFTIENRQSDIRQFKDGRILVRDNNDNRYEIADLKSLDKRSLKLLSFDL